MLARLHGMLKGWRCCNAALGRCITKGENMRDFQYQTWWDLEGSAIRPTDNEDIEEFAHRITQIAWSNSTFKTNEKLQVLMGKHTTFPIIKVEVKND